MMYKKLIDKVEWKGMGMDRWSKCGAGDVLAPHLASASLNFFACNEWFNEFLFLPLPPRSSLGKRRMRHFSLLPLSFLFFPKLPFSPFALFDFDPLSGARKARKRRGNPSCNEKWARAGTRGPRERPVRTPPPHGFLRRGCGGNPLNPHYPRLKSNKLPAAFLFRHIFYPSSFPQTARMTLQLASSTAEVSSEAR